ncbi:hypothetical protein E4U54_005022 [Claviceps lovelessii]|nr:hypothetical protein E4U54_005022 [Claviceps lovelessii]
MESMDIGELHPCVSISLVFISLVNHPALSTARLSSVHPSSADRQPSQRQPHGAQPRKDGARRDEPPHAAGRDASFAPARFIHQLTYLSVSRNMSVCIESAHLQLSNA